MDEGISTKWTQMCRKGTNIAESYNKKKLRRVQIANPRMDMLT